MTKPFKRTTSTLLLDDESARGRGWPDMLHNRIAVLLDDRDDRFDSAGYLLRLLVKVWEAKGATVSVLRGAQSFTPADVCIPHLDLTVTPPAYQQLLHRYPVAINRRLLDISKSTISSNLLAADDAYDGEVIVKTNCNYGGLPESRLKPRPAQRPMGRRIFDKLCAVLRGRRAAEDRAWRSIESIKSGDYPIFPSLRAVPPGIFANKNLIVEKFLPERDGSGDYRLRYCYFFGDRQINFLLRSKEPVVKGSNTFSCDETAAPPELDAIRRRLGLDYGKLDYVLRDGQVVLFDVNRTPASAALARYGLADHVVSHLAEGLAPMLESRPVTTAATV
jgi:hypothetical protein